MIGLIVVLYRPSAEQLLRLRHLVAQFPLVVAVSNTPGACGDNAAGADTGLAPIPGLLWLGNGNRGGIGGAFNRGAELLAQHGAVAFVLLDQDSVIPDHFHASLAHGMTGLLSAGQTCFLLGPRIFDVNLKRHLPAFLLRGGAAGATQARRCGFLISSGSLVTAAAWRRLGPWREDFVIDHVDSEYCLRATALGVPMYQLPTLELRHAIGRPVVRRGFGLTLRGLNHGAARRYYLARNALATARLHPSQWLAALALNLVTASQVLAVLVLEGDKRRKLAAIGTGWVDGLCGRSGPMERLHPRLACYFNALPDPEPAP